MNEYTNGQVKKENEQESLGYFLEAYEGITGDTIEVLAATERPDFICIRDGGSLVGVELAKVRRGHPNDIQMDEIIEKREFMLPEDALNMIQSVAANKEGKRSEQDWKLPDSTILLIELVDIPLAHIKNSISPQILPDLYGTSRKRKGVGPRQVFDIVCKSIEMTIKNGPIMRFQRAKTPLLPRVREGAAHYNAFFIAEKGDIGPENTHF